MRTTASEDYSNLIQSCDSLIKSGRLNAAAKALARVDIVKVPRPQRLDLARLCRRAGLEVLGLRILEPVFHPQPAIFKDARPDEAAEYAVLLQMNGAIDEALATLSKLDVERTPDVLLYSAYCHISRWDAEKAVACLRKYLKQDIAPSSRVIGRLNLSSALIVANDALGAVPLLSEIIEDARRDGQPWIIAKGLDLRAQALIRLGEFDAARLDLDAAGEFMETQSMRDRPWLEKWHAVIAAYQRRSVAPLLAFRALAEQRGDWESVRETDIHALRVEFDERRFQRLYFGTPFDTFRSRLTREFPHADPGDSLILGSGENVRVDLESGLVLNGETKFSVRGANLRILTILLRDLYRPLRLASLFAALFPNQHYDFFSSPGRVHQTIYRCRTWLKANSVPLSITETAEMYSVTIQQGGSVRLGLGTERKDKFDAWIREVRSRYGHHIDFSASEARDALSIPRTTFTRFLAWSLENRHLKRLGAGRSARYAVTGFDESSDQI